ENVVQSKILCVMVRLIDLGQSSSSGNRRDGSACRPCAGRLSARTRGTPGPRTYSGRCPARADPVRPCAPVPRPSPGAGDRIFRSWFPSCLVCYVVVYLLFPVQLRVLGPVVVELAVLVHQPLAVRALVPAQ